MKSDKHKTALTLVEMLTVVAIIAILAAIAIGIATRIDNQSKERLTENTFALLNAALGQFQDYGYNYRVSTSFPTAERQFYLGLDFPVDCNDFSIVNFPNELMKTLNTTAPVLISSIDGPIKYEIKYSGSEALYFFLSQVPTSRKTLDKIDSSLITARDADGNRMEISIDGRQYPLLRVIDPWGQTLLYDYYDEWESNLALRSKGKRNFPVITSAGPDKKFGNADDISSRNRN